MKIFKFIFCLYIILIVTNSTANTSMVVHKINDKFQNENYSVEILTLENKYSYESLNTPESSNENLASYKFGDFNGKEKYILVSSDSIKTDANGATMFLHYYTRIINLPAKLFKDIVVHRYNTPPLLPFDTWWSQLIEIIISLLIIAFFIVIEFAVCSFGLLFWTIYKTIVHPIDTILALPSALFDIVIETFKAGWEFIVAFIGFLSHIINSIY